MIRVLAPALVALFLTGCADPAITTAKRDVSEQLVDGQSARFENVVTQKTVMEGESTLRPVQAGEEAVCGWVNGKNAMGAYTGAERFLVKPGFSTFQTNDDQEWSSAFGMCIIHSDDKEASDRHTREGERAIRAYGEALRELQ